MIFVVHKGGCLVGALPVSRHCTPSTFVVFSPFLRYFLVPKKFGGFLTSYFTPPKRFPTSLDRFMAKKKCLKTYDLPPGFNISWCTWQNCPKCTIWGKVVSGHPGSIHPMSSFGCCHGKDKPRGLVTDVQGKPRSLLLEAIEILTPARRYHG